jgi:hypothetical protein
MVRLALLSALSDRADIGQIVVIDDWKIEGPKTKDAVTLVRKLKLSGSVLIVLAQDELDVERSFANLPQVQTTTFGELSAHDVIRSDWLVFSDRTLPSSPSQFSGTHVVGDEPAEAEAVEATPTEPAPVKAARAKKAAKTAPDAPKIKSFAEVETEADTDA